MNKRIYIVETSIQEIHYEGFKSFKSIETWAEERWDEYWTKIHVQFDEEHDTRGVIKGTRNKEEHVLARVYPINLK